MKELKAKEIEKEEKKETEEAPVENTETKSVIEVAQELKESIAKENDRREELLRREEQLAAKRMLSGKAEAGQIPEKPEPLSDTEYAEALERGEVNPLKEDGLI